MQLSQNAGFFFCEFFNKPRKSTKTIQKPPPINDGETDATNLTPAVTMISLLFEMGSICTGLHLYF